MRNCTIADVVVLGGGGAGLSAAIAAAESGAKVLLFEKYHEVGGSTGRSVGSLTSSRTPHQRREGIEDSPGDHYQDMGLFAATVSFEDNLILRRVLTDNMPDTFNWLLSLGLQFAGPMPEPPHRVPRMHNILPNSRAYIAALKHQAMRVGVTVTCDARARELLVKDERVVGARIETANGLQDVGARRGVIIASGDFSSGGPLKQRFLGELARIDGFNPANTGDGQVMCERLGVEVKNGTLAAPSLRFIEPELNLLRRLPANRFVGVIMKLAYRYIPPEMLRPFLLRFVTAILAPEPDLFEKGAIIINKSGERFGKETDSHLLRKYLNDQPGKEGYIVLDARLSELFSGWPNYISTASGSAYAYVNDYRRYRKDIFHQAETIEKLAESIAVSPEGLRRTIEDYNAKKDLWPRDAPPLMQGPYIALGPIKSWVVVTEGGVVVDEQHRVLNRKGEVVRGLYAAGSAGQGGLLLEGHGHHLGWAFTSGRRAGRFAATELGAD